MSSTGRGPRLGGPDDFYVTPSWAVDRFLEVWKPTEQGMWVEPAAGNGAIIKAVNARRPGLEWRAFEIREEEMVALEATGANVYIDDFLTRDWQSDGVSAVIGNPPFSLAMEFVRRALQQYPNARVAFLLRLNFAGSEERGEFMRRYPPSVYVLPNRPAFAGGKTDSCEYAWFTWPRGDHRERDSGQFRVLGSTPARERRKKIPDVGVASHGQSTLPNACDDGAAAIPRSENDGKGTADPDRNAAQMAHQYNVERPATPPAVPMEAGVVTSPGEQRALFGDECP